MDNLRLKQKGGLVGHPALLGDFEERQDQVHSHYTHDTFSILRTKLVYTHTHTLWDINL